MEKIVTLDYKDNYWQYLPTLQKYSNLITKDMNYMRR